MATVSDLAKLISVIDQLHERVALPDHHQRNGAVPPICRRCWNNKRGGFEVWPCPTIRALDEFRSK